MSHIMKSLVAFGIVTTMLACGSEPGCLCSDGATETFVPNLSGRPCDDLTPPEGFNFCFSDNETHTAPWVMGPSAGLIILTEPFIPYTNG